MEIKSNEIKMVDIDSIIPNPKNNNKHSAEQIDRLCKIIKHNGFRVPLIVSNRSGFLICGHGRLESAKKLGYEKVPVIYQDFENEAEEFQFLTADNEISRWAEFDKDQFDIDLKELGLDEDFDLDLFGLPELDIPVEVLDPQGDEDVVPELKPDPIAKRGDVWILGNHRLMCGDSTMIDDVEKLMDGHKADFGFCDPPYNLGFRYNEYDDNKSESEYIDFSKLWFSNLKMFTIRQAVTLGTKNISVMAMLDSVTGVACWVKKNWITSCKIAKLQQWEPIFFYGDYTKHKRASDLFEINRVVQKDVGDSHTCPKQIKLIEDIFKHYAGDSVLDLFQGSGTSIIAAEKLSKTCYAMELDPVYCDVIVRRWEEYTGKKAVLSGSIQEE